MSKTRRPRASCSTRAAERTLVEVEARLLAEIEGDAKAQAALGELEGREALAQHDPRSGLEPLHLRRRVTRSVDNRSRRQDGRERLEHERLAPLHADGPELNREDVAVPVDDEPGHPVALGVKEAQAGGVVVGQAERRAQRSRSLEALAEERGVDLRLGVANEQAHRDRGSRRVKAAAEEVATRIDDAHLVARCRTLVDGVDRLRVDPRMPGPDGLHVTGLQADRRHLRQRVIGPAGVGVDDYCVATPGP